MSVIAEADLRLPSMCMIRQCFDVPPPIDITREIDCQWERIRPDVAFPKGRQIAIGVGSRGIANLVPVVRAVVEKIKDAGYAPFVMPAMGSHGGATAQGQIDVLAALGVSADSVGAPIRADMDVIPMGKVKGIPIFQSKLAYQADGFILINRVKPHTDFMGPTESGIIKMMAIGLGNQIGAEHYHRLSIVHNMYDIISTAGKALIEKSAFLFGVALVENQDHQTAQINMALPQDVETIEKTLLKKAYRYLPKIPLKEIDLLIIDEMGKDISGAGIDPIISGRYNCAYMTPKPGPRISRIFVRNLTAVSRGCAIGIGQADMTTQRLVDQIDFKSTAANALTCCAPEDARLPLAFGSDREAVAAALMTIRPHSINDVRIVHIKNTLELTRMLVSTGCLKLLANNPIVQVSSQPLAYEFDDNGNFCSSFFKL